MVLQQFYRSFHGGFTAVFLQISTHFSVISDAYFRIFSTVFRANYSIILPNFSCTFATIFALFLSRFRIKLPSFDHCFQLISPADFTLFSTDFDLISYRFRPDFLPISSWFPADFIHLLYRFNADLHLVFAVKQHNFNSIYPLIFPVEQIDSRDFHARSCFKSLFFDRLFTDFKQQNNVFWTFWGCSDYPKPYLPY